ncbi:Thioredoxin-dependent 5'-adenylylsulfate reductase [bacterium HR39]|nr:Thioredoxin-dependent 5'-adenylylsulfate reductase [bacterium HR39]
MVASVDPALPVVFIDTGRLFPETLAYRDHLVVLLGLRDVRTVRPDPADLARHDPDGALHRHDPDLCCHIRKTEPLDRALSGMAAWITGRKRYQGGLRRDLPAIEHDPVSGLFKLNPLAAWTPGDVRAYRRLRGLPPHPLELRGYASVGCTTCTTPVRPGEPPRAGRWRGIDKSECGIHLAPVGGLRRRRGG